MDGWIEKTGYIYIYIFIYLFIYLYIHTHTKEYYLVLKMKEMLSYVKMWRDLEEILISEISQSQKGKNSIIPLM